MTNKYYIFNCKDKNKVHGIIKKILPENFPCILLSKNTMKAQLNVLAKFDVPFSVKILICDSEIGATTLKSEMLKFNMSEENINILNIPDYHYLFDIISEYNILSDTNNIVLTEDFNKACKNPFKLDDNYFVELCHEFYYIFVKNVIRDTKLPKVKIIDEMEGCLLFENSKYTKISNKWQQNFYSNLLPVNKKSENFSRPFAGSMLLAEYYPEFEKNNNYINHLYNSFLNRAKYAFALYYCNKNNTCYVVKKQKQASTGCFQYDIENVKYSYLNFIRVPEWIYDTPSQKLDIEQILTVKNIDVRTEAIKKIGIENLVSCGKIIDTFENYPENEWWKKSEYKLIDMKKIVPPVDYIDWHGNVVESRKRSYAPYLYMKNQTTGVYHLEGVSPHCKTLYDAIKMRYKGLNIPAYDIKEIK